jgi:hypothetical protein
MYLPDHHRVFDARSHLDRTSACLASLKVNAKKPISEFVLRL